MIISQKFEIELTFAGAFLAGAAAAAVVAFLAGAAAFLGAAAAPLAGGAFSLPAALCDEDGSVTQVVSIHSGWKSLDMDARRTFLTSLTFPPEPLGWSKTPTSTPRAMALLTWFKLAADDMSSLYLSAKNLVNRWELQCDQCRRDRSPRDATTYFLMAGRETP